MRLESKFKISRLLKYAVVAYIMISLFYTTNHYFTAHRSGSVHSRQEEVVNHLEALQEEQPHLPPPKQQQPVIQQDEEEKAVYTQKEKIIIDQLYKDSVTWPSLKGTPHTLSENLLKSKLFSSSMGYDNVTPYYFKASAINKKEDITLATLVTRNRFQVLSRLATNYKGPISAAIHVLDDKEKVPTLKELQKIYSENADMQKYVDVHLIIDNFDRQFNMWRNTAKLFTRTDYLMMLDVDFHLCTDFRKTIWENSDIADRLRQGKTALVVPAFEYLNQKDGMDFRTFPKIKQGVIKEVQDLQKLDSFHSSWVQGHGSTNYSKWYTADEMYPVSEYDFAYEPYVIYKKEGTPWCDERFIGYGANKAACLYEIFISGVDFWVLPNDFLIHQSHKYAEHDRTRERVHNRHLYDYFRTEICLRYSRKYVIEGTWYTPAADNMKKVCTDIPKWKYLSGIPKAQRDADKAAEEAAKKEEEEAAKVAGVVAETEAMTFEEEIVGMEPELDDQQLEEGETELEEEQEVQSPIEDAISADI